MTKQKTKKRMYFHGECVISEIKELPTGLKSRLDKDSIMIAESETVGNEHRVKIKEGVEFFEDEKGVLYMKNTVPTEVYCLQLLYRKDYGKSTKLLNMITCQQKLLKYGINYDRNLYYKFRNTKGFAA